MKSHNRYDMLIPDNDACGRFGPHAKIPDCEIKTRPVIALPLRAIRAGVCSIQGRRTILNNGISPPYKGAVNAMESATLSRMRADIFNRPPMQLSSRSTGKSGVGRSMALTNIADILLEKG